jgi:hypothetical protein
MVKAKYGVSALPAEDSIAAGSVSSNRLNTHMLHGYLEERSWTG